LLEPLGPIICIPSTSKWWYTIPYLPYWTELYNTGLHFTSTCCVKWTVAGTAEEILFVLWSLYWGMQYIFCHQISSGFDK
jgi:hypothetical protein